MIHPLQKIFGLLLVIAALGVGLSYAPDRPVQTLVARWAPPPSDFLELDGQLVHYRDEGPRSDPLPVVLVHGTGDSLHTWQGWAAALRGQRRVISFDLPGFGLTGPSPAGDYRGDTYARFVLALMDALKVQRFVIGGCSLGGEVAWRTAAMAPQRVDRLILVDASGYPFVPEHIPLAFRLARMPVVKLLAGSLTPRSLVDSSARSVFGDPAKVTPALVDRYYELSLREGNRHALVQRLELLDNDFATERIRTLKLPTLILWGGRDHLIPPVNAQRFHADIARSTLVMFDTLGHVPQEEDPQASVQPVKAFLGLR